ncbi:MAG: MBL fold metallo-hydrolase, partial [Planctomycetes bacterium]|nr:MBL fold metallo-hydrolase [Planctomycetota bacterium]
DRFLVENYVRIASEWGFDVEEAPIPSEWWDHGSQVRVGETVFQVIHTPGHSPGSVSLHCASGELIEGASHGRPFVLTGDTLMGFSIGRTDFPRSSARELERSILERLYTLPEDTVVYPGHMHPTTIGEEMRHNQFIRPPHR